jgi:hypothetical protein
MITAYQLAQRVDTEYPNNGFVYKPEYENLGSDIIGYTALQQGFINYVNSSLARANNIILLDDTYEFPTIAGQAMYELPVNCEQRNIMEITRDYGEHGSVPIRCRWARDGEIMAGNMYFNAYGNMIGLFPVPSSDGQKITIAFKKTPRAVLTKDDPIEVKDKYIDLLVYSIVIDMASSGSNPDIEVANNYTARYNALLQDALIEKSSENPFYPKTKDNKRPPLQYLRRG